MTDNATVAGLAEAGALPPRDFTHAPQRVREIAGVPLDLPASISQAVDLLAEKGFFERDALEEAVAALILGHLILAGPPGTGKTSLARALAEVFNAHLIAETANPEWSVYDVIGTQTLKGANEVVPKHGLVTNAVLTCASSTVDNLDSGEGAQATWLLIDEMNRADIDRAFGPLFTALAGGDDASMTLDYMDQRPSLALPNRFRIIASVNEYDTRFVNSMSAALRRRFSKVTILPPPNDGDGRSPVGEFDMAIKAAEAKTHSALGVPLAKDLRDTLASHGERVRSLFGFFRHTASGSIPLGTAQLIDVVAYFFVFSTKSDLSFPSSLSAAGDAQFWATFDRALVARLIPSIETDSTRSRIDQRFASEFATSFPDLPRTAVRIEAFLSGQD